VTNILHLKMVNVSLMQSRGKAKAKLLLPLRQSSAHLLAAQRQLQPFSAKALSTGSVSYLMADPVAGYLSSLCRLTDFTKSASRFLIAVFGMR